MSNLQITCLKRARRQSRARYNIHSTSVRLHRPRFTYFDEEYCCGKDLHRKQHCATLRQVELKVIVWWHWSLTIHEHSVQIHDFHQLLMLENKMYARKVSGVEFIRKSSREEFKGFLNLCQWIWFFSQRRSILLNKMKTQSVTESFTPTPRCILSLFPLYSWLKMFFVLCVWQQWDWGRTRSKKQGAVLCGPMVAQHSSVVLGGSRTFVREGHVVQVATVFMTTVV